jgi:hypothetical protein
MSFKLVSSHGKVVTVLRVLVSAIDPPPPLNSLSIFQFEDEISGYVKTPCDF